MTEKDETKAQMPESTVEEIALSFGTSHQVELQGVVIHKNQMTVAGIYCLIIAVMAMTQAAAPMLGYLFALVVSISFFKDYISLKSQGFIRGALLKNTSNNGIIWTSQRLPSDDDWEPEQKPMVVIALSTALFPEQLRSGLRLTVLVAFILLLVSAYELNFTVVEPKLHWYAAGFSALSAFLLFGLKPNANPPHSELKSMASEWAKWMDNKSVKGAVLLTEVGFNGEAVQVFLRNHERFLPSDQTLFIQYSPNDSDLEIDFEIEKKNGRPYFCAMGANNAGYTIAHCSGNAESLKDFNALDERLSSPQHAKVAALSQVENA